MFKNEYTLTVDLKKKMTAITPKFVQYDNATLVFKIFDDGRMYDLTPFTKAEVAHKRPDGQVVVGTADIESLISGERVIRYNYLGSEMHNTGFVETSLSIFSNDKKVSTQPFKIEIITDYRDGLVQNSKEEVGLLQELIADVSSVLDDANEAIDNANSAVTVANKATTDANTAITNANLAITEAQNAANATIKVKDDTLIAKAEAEHATINANNAVSNLVHRGEYNPATSYIPRNIVSLDGSSYMNILPSTGVSPTDNSRWKLIASKGDTGLRGIQGIQGEKGDTGKGFSIAKTYPSVAAMYADYNNPLIEIGSFVLINASDINNVENAMLFVKTNIEYSYLTDLSGAQGIKGEKGNDGVSFTWKDNYNNSTSYLRNDVVSYNGSSYVALQNSKGNLPTNALFWSLVAQRGVDGTGSVSSVNTKLPNINGDVTLTPSDIGASPSNHTHTELHTHTNKTVLDGLSDDAGQLKYKGTTVGSVTSVNGQVGDVTGLETVADSNSKLATKVDKVTGKGLSTEDYTTAEKTKLSGIEVNANNYSHPTTHPPSIIAQDASNRFMTDAEKTKLSGIATNANNYTHPANHPPSIITQDANNRFMTDAEKTKLNGIQTGAQVNAITSVNGATGAITGLATDTSVDNKVGTKIDKTSINQPNGVAGLDQYGQLGTDMIIDKVSQQPLSQSVADLREHMVNQQIHVTQTKKNEWDAKATPAYVDNKIGILTDLQTTEKSNLVGAVNENVTQLANKATKTELTNGLAPKADRTYVDTQIANIGNASPKGTYATLSALQSAYPSGATGVYVVIADGKWYYWNGTSWIAGGIYQSSGVADKSITLSKIDDSLSRSIKSVEVLEADPTNLWNGRMWLVSTPTILFQETFTQVNGTQWDGLKWRPTVKNINASQLAPSSVVDVTDNKGSFKIASISDNQTVAMQKVTQDKIIKTNEYRELEFEISDYYEENVTIGAFTIGICPTVPSSSQYFFDEVNWIRMVIGYEAAGRFILVQNKVSGNVTPNNYKETILNNTGLKKYKFVFFNQNHFKLERFNGLDWITLYENTNAGLTFTDAYVVLERSTHGSTSIKTSYVDSIKVKN